MRSRSRWLLAAALLAAVAMPLFIAVRSARYIAGVTRAKPSRVTPEQQAAARAAGAEEITLHTSDGLALPGWFKPGANRGVIVFVHGGGGNRASLLPDALSLARHGWGFLTYDMRGDGESGGGKWTWGQDEQRDLRAALDFVAARPDVDPARVAAAGFSIGATTVALETADDPRARAVILYAIWTSLEDEQGRNSKFGPISWLPMKWMLGRAGIDLQRVRPIDHIREISPRPLMMIAGGSDRDTPLPVMERMFAAAGEPKRLWVVPGADHGEVFKVAPAEYEKRVLEFLEQSLPPAQPPPSAPPLSPPGK